MTLPLFMSGTPIVTLSCINPRHSSNALTDVGIVTKQTHLRILRNIIIVQIV